MFQERLKSMKFVDNQTVMRVLNGDLEAFREIVLEYNAPVTAYVAGALINKAEVDELVQDVFLAAYRNLDSYRGQSSLKSWLMGIARNKILAHLRSKRRWNAAMTRFREQILLLSDQAAEHLRQGAISGRVDVLRACLEKLPDDLRGLVQQCYLQEISIRRAAETSERSADAVRSSLFRARKQLRTCMESGS